VLEKGREHFSHKGWKPASLAASDLGLLTCREKGKQMA
jgi:hypothetical protein